LGPGFQARVYKQSVQRVTKAVCSLAFCSRKKPTAAQLTLCRF